jgi:predicted N-acetyltransferase YhbS
VTAAPQALTGTRYLAAATALLQRARQASPTGGMWEAADLQWWWRRDQHEDAGRALVWSDDAGPAAAVVLTRERTGYDCSLLRPSAGAPGLDVLWPAALELLGGLRDHAVTMLIRDDDPALLELTAAAGFAPDGGSGGSTWLDADRRPPVSPLPAGFTLADRRDGGDRAHHLAARNGDQVAQRLAECSLYRPDLDLTVLAPGGEVAGYGLFWADPVTGVGLVEPMRTEDAFQHRGLARHVLTSGLDRLARAGCTRFKVGYSGPAGHHLYLSTGFQQGATDHSYERPTAS